MSAISETLKADKEFLFLLELDFDGWKQRFSTKTVSVPNAGGDDLLFDGLITNRIQVSSRLDLISLRQAIGSISIELANKMRFQDNEIMHRLDGGIGKLYVWSKSLDWSDIEDTPIFLGYFRKEAHNKYIYRFVLDDPLYIKSKQLPATTINSNTWSSMRTEGGDGSVAGKFEALAFGEWSKGFPLLCVDTVAFKYIAGVGEAKSVDADYVATTVNVYDKDGGVIDDGDYVFYPKGVDEEGNIVAYFDFTGDQVANEPLSCSIKMLKDNSGVYTEAAGNLIEHPADIVYYLLDQRTNLALGEIDITSLRTMRSALPGYKFACIVNETVSTVDLIDRVLVQSGCARVQRNGRVGILVIDFDSMPSAKLKRFNLVGKTTNISKTPLSQVCNSLRVLYKLNPTTQNWEKELVLDKNNNSDCEKSNNEYGELPQAELHLTDVHIESIAVACAGRYIRFNAFRHDMVKCFVPPWDGFDLYEGDVAELTVEEGASSDGEGWIDEKFMLLQRSFRQDTVYQEWWRIAT